MCLHQVVETQFLTNQRTQFSLGYFLNSYKATFLIDTQKLQVSLHQNYYFPKNNVISLKLFLQKTTRNFSVILDFSSFTPDSDPIPRVSHIRHALCTFFFS